MRKRILIEIAVVLLSTIVLNRETLYEIYKLNQIRNTIINSLNGKFNERVDPHTIILYEVLHKPIEELNNNNITELIDAYIDCVNDGMDTYIKNNEKAIEPRRYRYTHIRLKEFDDFEYGKYIGLGYDDIIIKTVGESFTSEDVTNYKNGTFKAVLINKLKECLEYKEHENKIEWYINSSVKKKIELPYECYIDYEPWDMGGGLKLKRAIDVTLDKNYRCENKTGRFAIKYETFDGEIIEDKFGFERNNSNGKEYYTILTLEKLLLNGDFTPAKASVCSYTYMKWRAAADKS